MQPLKLLVLYGGKSGEHEISLISAASVLSHLDPSRYQIIPVGMDQEGRCFLNDYQELLTYQQALPVVTVRSRPLDSLMHNGRLSVDADVVFPVVHGPLYEDGCLQGLLELTDVAYVGCGVLSSAIGMDKDMQRRIVCVDGIQSARYRLLTWDDDTQLDLFCHQTVAELGWPLFVKPCAMGSSVGIRKASSMQELLEAIKDALRYDDEVLVEEYIIGREIEVAVLENATQKAKPKVSLPGEICVHHPDGFYSYAAKYLESGQTDLIVPAVLDATLTRRLQQVASDIFVRLKCKGMARIDFFVDDRLGKIYFNEINTIPGFTSISMYPKMWEASGLPYAELLDGLIQLANKRHDARRKLVRHYQ